jgi:hypothetical protein
MSVEARRQVCSRASQSLAGATLSGCACPRRRLAALLQLANRAVRFNGSFGRGICKATPSIADQE